MVPEFREKLHCGEISLFLYRFPSLYWLNKRSSQLAKRLEYGLSQVHKDGSLEQIVTNYIGDDTIDQIRKKVVLPLENPFLSKKVKELNKIPHLWCMRSILFGCRRELLRGP